ncbi:zinc ABC transporter substrate-binding protein ZnuA [Candidatus Profftia tarda]|uniref:zinc ABC transporter substrate-binding protein ZnuA n=1 Tax=Candidatus Profftia tarda TaxID=1177216 RepID=UPI001FEA9CCE|nr:zinc ABC transporter substrate-binding protein ZnuA [Candidatus Profftia tarda]
MSHAGTNYAEAKVLTSIRPLGFIASAITDGVTQTDVLLPDGASPHNYALKPSDIERLHNADLVVWVGPTMESFLTKITQKIEDKNNLILSILPNINSLLIKSHQECCYESLPQKNSIKKYKNINNLVKTHSTSLEKHNVCNNSQYNLHIWLSPAIAKNIAIAIHSKLLLQNPQKKNKLDLNLRKFEEQLEQTEKKIVIMLQPVLGKGYFVFHDAYGYFEKTFGLTPLGYFTVNPAIQPGAQRLHQIRTQLVKPQAIFAEPQFRPAIISVVSQGKIVHQGTLDPLGTAIALGANSYMQFLTQLSQQYVNCLNEY